MNSDDMQTLKEFAILFEELGIEHWIDSGTLLGIYRDSKLISNDKDIDISIIDKKNQLSELIRLLKRTGYGKISLKKFNNRIHKIKIIRKFSRRTIDISIFRKYEDDLLMPVIRLEKIYENLIKLNFFLTIKLLFAKTYIALSKWFNLEIDFSSYMLQPLLRKKEIWCYPSDIVLPTYKSSKSGFYYPSNTEKFLAFRYGDWKTPVNKWKSENSDKGFILDDRYNKLL